MTRPALAGLALLLLGCETRSAATDSTAAAAAAPVDTAAPVVVNATADSARRADSMRVADSLARAARTPAPPRPVTPTPRARADSVKLSPNIGRDSAIRRPRPFPSTDTTKRP